MRFKKISELIHHSEQFPNLTEARVSVHFEKVLDKEDGEVEVIENSSLVISRTANKKSKSNYFVNEKKSNWTEVTSLLKKEGVDLDHNRFLILQGEVEQIALMKPKARNAHEEGILEYLEDIIGSNVYVKPIEETAQELEKCNEDHSNALNRVNMVAQALSKLTDLKDEAVAHFSKQSEIVEKESVLCQMRRHAAEEKVKEKNESKKALHQRLEEQREKFQEAKKRLETLELELRNEKNLHNKLQAERERTKVSFSCINLTFFRP